MFYEFLYLDIINISIIIYRYSILYEFSHLDLAYLLENYFEKLRYITEYRHKNDEMSS